MAEFKRKFTQNFIDDHRYRYLLDGLKETLIIAVCAVIIGILIGFIVAIIRSTHDKNHSKKKGFSRFIIGLLNFICKVYLTIIRGTPVLVQLLISFYCIFTAPDTSKTFVAIMAFGINSGAYVAEIVRSGIMSIDNGQFEAGRSLGFNYFQTMRYIVVPQMFKSVLPTLCNEFIALLKETSVVGYVGVIDITKAGNVIAGVTYSYYIPLLTVAAIYLVMVMILSYFVGKLEKRLRKNER